MIINSSFEEPVVQSNEILMSFIIPVFNQSNLTKTALKSLSSLSSNYEIIIIDNNSTDDTAEVVMETLERWPKNKSKLVYICNPENLIHSGGCNKGFKEARGKHICFLNNDIMFAGKDPDFWPTFLIEWTEKGYLVGPTAGHLDDDFSFIKEDNELSGNLSKNDYLSGWCLAGSKETFDKLRLNKFFNSKTKQMEDGLCFGPWNEYFPMYFNDYEISDRAKKLQIPLKIVSVPLVHLGKQTTKKLNNVSELYLEGKNKIMSKYEKYNN